MVSCLVSDGSSAKGGLGLRVDMAKVRRPRIQGLMGSDLYKLTLCLICVWFVVSDGSSAKASSGLRVDMAKVRRPRIRGLINSDL